MILYRIYIIFMVFSLLSCRSINKSENSYSKGYHKFNKVSLDRENIDSINYNTFKYSSITDLYHKYNISLHSNDSTKPAILQEYIKGKPYREIRIINGSLDETSKTKKNESKDLIDSSKYVIRKYKLDLKSVQDSIYFYKREEIKIKSQIAKIHSTVCMITLIIVLLCIIYLVDKLKLFSYIRKKVTK